MKFSFLFGSAIASAFMFLGLSSVGFAQNVPVFVPSVTMVAPGTKIVLKKFSVVDEYSTTCTGPTTKKVDTLYSAVQSAFSFLSGNNGGSHIQGHLTQTSTGAKECVMIPEARFEAYWTLGQGGRSVTSETLTARYGGKTCTFTMVWSLMNKPFSVSSSCTPLSYSLRLGILKVMGGFPYVSNEIGSSVVKKDTDVLIRYTTHTVDTRYELRVKGDWRKEYMVYLNTKVFALKNFSPFGVILKEGETAVDYQRQLTDEEYTVAGYEPIVGIIPIKAKGGTVIDVTPLSSEKHYTFDTPEIINVMEVQ